MNLLLLAPDEVAADGTALLTGRRHQHAREVLRVQAGEVLRVGVRRGRCGTGEVIEEGPDGLRLKLTLDADPPPRPGVSLMLAIPRPKALKKIIPAVAALGIDRLMLVNAARVEKSYFDASVLAPSALDALVDLGLEQARDTCPPVIDIRDRFKPFVEDELDAWAGDSVRLLPHPPAVATLPRVEARRPVVLAIGPDGGWVPFEVGLLERQGFLPVSLGPRVLRVEVAVSYILGRVR